MKQKHKNCMDRNILLDVNTSNVFVAKSAKNHAFIEQFNYSSVSFTQKDLGTILGFFVVRDNTETSENIVNFLASEVKKKYFSPIQKNAEEKFESTLHHINRALEEIANIGNIEWLGQIDGAVCVIDATTIHFSVTGNAHILLLRDNALINISSGLAPEDAAEQPLKTFVDISSGDLCPGDKIIITSQELLDLIPFDELQKNAIRFGQENFIQFIETVLTNECSLATTTIVDIHEKEKTQTQLNPSPVAEVPKNAFSADAFKEESEQLPEILDEVEEMSLEENQPAEYTDPRTGHIHIQGDDEPIPEQTFIESSREKLLELFGDIKEFTTTKWNIFSKKFFKLKNKTEPPSKENIIVTEETFDDTEELDDIFDSLGTSTTTPSPDATNNSEYEVSEAKFSQYFDIILKKIKWIGQIVYSTTKKIFSYCTRAVTKLKDSHKKDLDTSRLQNQLTKQKRSLLPSMRHITQSWHEMHTQTKLIAVGILIFVIVTPIIFSQLSRSSQQDNDDTKNNGPETSQEEMAQEEMPTEQKPTSQNTINDPTILLKDLAPISTIVLNEKEMGITKNAIILFNSDSDREKFTVPKDAGDITHAVPMDDLGFIFFLTTKDHLYSFSPISKKFIQQKNIPTLDHTKIKALGTYMTYLYTLDDTMITRYTRQENGFADGDDWLKKSTDFSNVTTFAIDEDIYTAKNGNVSKFTQGKKVSFSQDPDIKNASLIYTTEDTDFMWILDKENATLFKTKKATGEKVERYIHKTLGDATQFSINERNGHALITTSDQIISFEL